jgi:hypothetical protein
MAVKKAHEEAKKRHALLQKEHKAAKKRQRDLEEALEMQRNEHLEKIADLKRSQRSAVRAAHAKFEDAHQKVDEQRRRHEAELERALKKAKSEKVRAVAEALAIKMQMKARHRKVFGDMEAARQAMLEDHSAAIQRWQTRHDEELSTVRARCAELEKTASMALADAASLQGKLAAAQAQLENQRSEIKAARLLVAGSQATSVASATGAGNGFFSTSGHAAHDAKFPTGTGALAMAELEVAAKRRVEAAHADSLKKHEVRYSNLRASYSEEREAHQALKVSHARLSEQLRTLTQEHGRMATLHKEGREEKRAMQERLKRFEALQEESASLHTTLRGTLEERDEAQRGRALAEQALEASRAEQLSLSQALNAGHRADLEAARADLAMRHATELEARATASQRALDATERRWAEQLKATEARWARETEKHEQLCGRLRASAEAEKERARAANAGADAEGRARALINVLLTEWKRLRGALATEATGKGRLAAFDDPRSGLISHGLRQPAAVALAAVVAWQFWLLIWVGALGTRFERFIAEPFLS